MNTKQINFLNQIPRSELELYLDERRGAECHHVNAKFTIDKVETVRIVLSPNSYIADV